MSSNIKFNNKKEEAENKKKELLSNSDIYIQLSEFESFGISILEAMSYGLPIITTGVGGVTDLVKDMKNGIIVQRHNYASIFNAIMFFVENELDRIKFGLESKRISKQYFPEKIEEKLDKIYNEILND